MYMYVYVCMCMCMCMYMYMYMHMYMYMYMRRMLAIDSSILYKPARVSMISRECCINCIC